MVYDANTGQNITYDTQEEALEAFWKNVVKLARHNFYNTAYMVIEEKENGAKRFYNDGNQEIDRPITTEEIESLIEKVRAEMNQ